MVNNAVLTKLMVVGGVSFRVDSKIARIDWDEATNQFILIPHEGQTFNGGLDYIRVNKSQVIAEGYALQEKA